MEIQEMTSYESVATLNDLEEEAFTKFCKNQHVSSENCEDMVTAFREAYVGYYFDEGEFAKEYFLESYDIDGIPSVLFDSIDWGNVWESWLRHDFDYIDGYVFRNI